MGPPPTLLPGDPEAEAALGRGEPAVVAAAHPSASGGLGRVGRRRSERRPRDHRVRLRAHRVSPWSGPVAAQWLEGFGPVPYGHEPNRGFLRCVAVLARAPISSVRRTSSSVAVISWTTATRGAASSGWPEDSPAFQRQLQAANGTSGASFRIVAQSRAIPSCCPCVCRQLPGATRPPGNPRQPSTDERTTISSARNGGAS